MKVLLFTGGEIHDHRGCGDEILRHLEGAGCYDVTRVEDDLEVFARPDLAGFDCVVFYYTVGEISDAQLVGLSDFIASGKGFVPVHSGADSFRDSDDYRAIVGGYFVTHPHYRSYQVSVLDREHEITRDLDEFTVTDEQYITSYDTRVNVLATALWQGKAWPVAWTKTWGKGRVFYLALGHDPAACRDPNFGLLLTRGVKWAGSAAAG
ncbi:MAG: hypothetical protein KatS3mg024_1031 [Armatimonadota bacterium]|nr:MAG: hypothetical protein KatS3mg024_1031 [Armatimonadota bacterium]